MSERMFVSRPTAPERIEAIQYDGTNDSEVAEFVERSGGQLIDWIGPNRWVTYDGNAEGFPVPVGVWVTRRPDGGFGEMDLYEDDEFRARYQPEASGTDSNPTEENR